MASRGPASIEPPPPPPPPPPDPKSSGGRLVGYEDFIENQLRKTRSHVRSVDFAVSLMVLVAGTMAYLLLAVLVDHWLFTGGLGLFGRFLLWAVYLAAAAYWIATRIVPLLVKKINPLYAAETIERSKPTLKNTLLNFLLFRANPAGVHQRVFQAIEEQAATNLVGVPVESAVDRSRLIRLGYVLVGILVVCAAYTLLSPKDLFKTVRRVALPWADISPPTRTNIDEITPGDASAFRGQQIEVKAHVEGLPSGEKVMLYYTTADRQIVDRAVAMKLPPDGYRHVALLPAGDSALEQTLTYRIEAGDAVTRPYAIEVVAAPTIVVRAVEYEYPKYTGLLTQRVEHQGDVKAIEGTRVTLEALANQDIDAAHVDFDCDDTLDLRMRADGQTARATFGLSLKDDRRTPVHGSYQVIFKNTTGEQNPRPVRHQINVTRDISPEIQFVAPRKDEIELPLDAAVDLEVVANDPDFALSRVRLLAAKGSDQIIEQPLLEEAWRGQFVKKFRFQPRELGLKSGDVVDYWAVAVDNKDPRPNQSQTPRRQIRIVSPSGRPGDQDQLAQNETRDQRQRESEKEKGQRHDNKQPRDAQPEQDDESDMPETGEAGQADKNAQRGDDAGEDSVEADDSGEGDPQDASQGTAGRRAGDGQSNAAEEPEDGEAAEPAVPNDGTNDGEAIERILEHREKQNEQQEQEPAQREQQQGGQRQGQQQPGQQDSDGGEGRQSAKQRQGDSNASRQNRDEDDRQQQPERQGGSGANQTGQGREADEEHQGGRTQRQRGDQRQADRQRRDSQEPQNGKPQGKDRQQAGDPSEPEPGAQRNTESKEKPQSGKAPNEQQPPGTQDAQSSGEDGKAETPEQPGSQSDPSQNRDVRRERGEGTDSQNAQRQGDGQPNESHESRQASQDNNTREDGTPQDPSTKGQGAGASDDPLRNPDKKPPQDQQQRPDAQGGERDQQKGDSGGGQKSDENQGSPGHKPSRPTSKTKPQAPDEEEQRPEGPEQSSTTSERESETESQEDGEQSGGGKRGGGQKANKSGTGGAGQNTAADDGAGRSDDAGDGETSDRIGGDRQANRQTGQSGSKTGPGSRTKPSDGENEKSGGKSDPKEPSDSPAAQSPSSQDPQGTGAQGGENPSDSRPGPSSPREQKWTPGVDKADDANLEYARKATDLALEHLKDQLAKGQPDPQLLDRLGWSRRDLENFVKRWEAMRGNAKAPNNSGAGGRRELDETLRSLGLKPRATTLDGKARDDRSAGYKESPRITPPAEYSEAFKAYTQGTARGGE